MFPWTKRGRRAQGAVQVPPGVVVAVDGLLHDAQPLLGLVFALDGKRVDRHVEPGFEGDHLGAHALHEEGQVAGGRSELQHALAGEVHAAEVVGLVAPQVPHAGQHRAVGKLHRVVPDEVAEVGTLAALREGGLEAPGRAGPGSRGAGRWGAGGRGRGRRRPRRPARSDPPGVSRRRSMGRHSRRGVRRPPVPQGDRSPGVRTRPCPTMGRLRCCPPMEPRNGASP